MAGADRPAAAGLRPLSGWAFAAVAVASFGGPLALAALSAPPLLGAASPSAGLAGAAGVCAFAAPLAIWLRFSRHVSSAGGLYAFVEAAAGRRIALIQASVWTISYLLYLIYTTVQIVYDVLPAALPGERRYETLLALLIPIAIAGVMIAGRAAAVLVIAAIAGGQLVLGAALDGVTLAHLSTPVSSFGASAPAGPLAKASAKTSLLYVCGSLPLFLGGELARPAQTIRRGLIGSYLLTALVVLLAVAPLATAPGVASTALPGVTVALQFSGSGLADAIGIGVAASIAGVMMCEYLALSRLAQAVGRWRPRPVAIAIGAVMVAAAPVSLIDPDGFYGALIKPSLIALWLSQLVVFAVYPRFAARHRQGAASAWVLSAVATSFAVYGLVTAVQQSAS